MSCVHHLKHSCRKQRQHGRGSSTCRRQRDFEALLFFSKLRALVAPDRAILRYHRCGNLKVPPFWGITPFFTKHPQDNFGLQNVNWHPPKCKLTPSNLQVLYRNTQKSPLGNFNFGGRQFAFWRLKLSWGGLYINRGTPKKGVTFSFSPLSLRYPISRDTFLGRAAAPQHGATPHLRYLV